MNPPKLHLFGLPRLEWEGQEQQLPMNTPVSLLVRLAVAGDWVPRQQLAWLYRPDEEEEDALRYLRLQLHRAQQYPWAAALESERDRLRWQADTDLATFRAAMALEDWSTAVSLATAPLLAGRYPRGQDEYATWLADEQAAVESDLRAALLQLAAGLERQGNYKEAARQCSAALKINELDEDALVGQLRNLALDGQRDEALRRYREFTDLLQAELDMEPAGRTRELAGQIERDELQGRAGATSSRQQLPRVATTFVGRRDELAELQGLLQDADCKLLSLVGIGGTGKTRLALALAERCAGDFADGFRFVSLLLARDAAGAGREIGAAFGLSAATGTDGLFATLEESELLLILDNCEQVEGLPELLSELITRCPSLKIVLTSRRRPGVQGEWTYDLTGLSTYREQDSESEAFTLFETAARRVSGGLQWSDAESAEARRITELVQGLPLALELAASWLRIMSVSEIRQRLETDLELLETDQSDLPLRHRSLSAVLERTWQDLEPFATQALMRFVSFSGSASLPATQAVARVSLPQLLSLVNQALLIRDGQGRIHIHPLLARFSLTMRESHPELAAEADQDHTEWFSSLLINRERGSADQQLVADLEPDLSNLESAWAKLLEAGDTDQLLKMADVLFALYSMHGHGIDTHRNSLQLLPPDKAPELRCRVLLSLSALLRERGGPQEAHDHAAEALDIATGAALDSLIGVAHRHLGDASQIMGDYAAAEEHYTRATTQFEAEGNVRELANSLNSLGSLEAVRENYAAATVCFQRCSRLFAQLDDAMNYAIALNNLGYLADVQGNFDAAAGLYEECLEAFERIGYNRGAAAVHNNLVVLYGTLGRMEEAELAGQASLELKRQIGDDQGRIITIKNLADLALRQGKPEAARRRYLDALNLAHELGTVPRLVRVLPGLCRALRRTGEESTADELARALMLHPLTTESDRKALATDWPELAGESAGDAAVLDEVLQQFLAVAA